MLSLSTEIISVDGSAIDPVPTTVIERFSPSQELTVKVDKMPKELASTNPARIELADTSAPIDVIHNSWPFIEVGRPGTLTPVMTPCPAIRDDASLREIRFGILNFFNFNRMLGTGSERVDDRANNRTYIRGRAPITAGPWLIEVQEVDDVASVVKQREGIRLAHTGTIRTTDGSFFQAGEVLKLVRTLRQFLSFAGGSGVGLCRVEGDDDQGQRVSVRWGTEYVSVVEQSRFSWLPTLSATDALSSVFAEYYRQISVNDPKRFAIDNALGSYIENVDSGMLTDLPRIQIALESLCSLTMGCIHNMTDALQQTLQAAHIPLDVPTWLSRLDAFRTTEQLATAPAVFVRLRNWMVHGNPKIEGVSSPVVWDACQLGLWYVELLLLRQFNYKGRYRIRGDGSVENVPWATK